MKSEIQKNPKVFFIGIGGIGLSSLARWFKSESWTVEGSDASSSIVTDELIEDGIGVKIGHKRENISSDISLVVFSQAVKADNPELKAAKRLKIPCLTYPEAVGELTNIYQTVAIAGAHGKSTTSAMTGLMLASGKFDPTMILGVRLNELGGRNFRFGRTDLLVLEADEYGRAFHNYFPALTVVTNIDREHLDIFGTFAGVKSAFLKFLSNVRKGGTYILNGEDPGLLSIKPKIEKLAAKKDVSIVWYGSKGPIAAQIKKILSVPGKHNLSNAVAAYHVGRSFGMPKAAIFRSLAKYKGAWRRLELKGKYGGALVYDDYAHHPTEIKATLQALRERYPDKKLLCVFQPHQAKRLSALFSEFQTAFDGSDETLILPAYAVKGRDSVDPKKSSESLVKSIQKRQPKKPLFYLSDVNNLEKAISGLGGELKEKVIVMMGAGSIAQSTAKLLK